MNNLKLVECNYCESEYKPLLGRTLNDKFSDVCPCCDSRFEDVQKHLKEVNSEYFKKLKNYKNMLDNMSDDEFTDELRDEIFNFTKLELSYEDDEINFILSQDKKEETNSFQKEKEEDNQEFLETYYAKVA